MDQENNLAKNLIKKLKKSQYLHLNLILFLRSKNCNKKPTSAKKKFIILSF